MRRVWHKILQKLCGLRGHDWHFTSSCGRQVRYCRKCGKMEYVRFSPHHDTRPGAQKDADALRGDWAGVGNDIQKGINRFRTEEHI